MLMEAHVLTVHKCYEGTSVSDGMHYNNSGLLFHCTAMTKLGLRGSESLLDDATEEDHCASWRSMRFPILYQQLKSRTQAAEHRKSPDCQEDEVVTIKVSCSNT